MKYAVVLVRFTPAYVRTMSGDFDSFTEAVHTASRDGADCDWFFIMETMTWTIAAQGNPREAYALIPGRGTVYHE